MTTVSGATGGMMLAAGFELGAAAGALAKFATMEVAVGRMLAGAFAPAAPPITATMPSSGKANVDLGDGATLSIDESNSSVTIHEANGHETQVWGDPHVNVDGQHIGDFYGDTTFQLQDGTKITIQTQPAKNGSGVFYADKVVITRGGQACTVSGVSEQTKGDLQISTGSNGALLDAATPDGLQLSERAGGGWNVAGTGRQVTQADFDTTRGLPAAEREFGQALGAAIGLWFSAGVISGALAGGGAAAHSQHAGSVAERVGHALHAMAFMAALEA